MFQDRHCLLQQAKNTCKLLCSLSKINIQLKIYDDTYKFMDIFSFVNSQIMQR